MFSLAVEFAVFSVECSINCNENFLIIYNVAQKAGIIESLEKSGAVVVHSCCPGMVDRSADAAEKLVFAN